MRNDVVEHVYKETIADRVSAEVNIHEAGRRMEFTLTQIITRADPQGGQSYLRQGGVPFSQVLVAYQVRVPGYNPGTRASRIDLYNLVLVI